jgi:hypothetical protein
VAELISQHHPRSHRVVDRQSEGYSTTDSYGNSSWVETSSEVAHDEYDSGDGTRALGLIDAVPGRRAEVLAHLRVINPELSAVIAGLLGPPGPGN